MGGRERQLTIGALPFFSPRGGASFITIFFPKRRGFLYSIFSSSPKSLAVTYINDLGEQNDLVSWYPCGCSICSEMKDASLHANGQEAFPQSESGSSKISFGTKIYLIVGMAAAVRIKNRTSGDCSFLSPFLGHLLFIMYVGHSPLYINKETNSER